MKGKMFSLFPLILVLVLDFKEISADICASSSTELNSSSTGNFSSPNFPSKYPHNTNKTWKIVAPVGQVIDLYFSTFALERSNSCQHDYVKIRNNCGDAAPMAVYCDHTARPLRSSSNVLWVEFRSDVSGNDKGFEAIFVFRSSNTSKLLSCPRPSDNAAKIDYCPVGDQVLCCNKNDSNCRVNKILTAKSGTITSPGHPGYYPHGAHYFWRITVPEGYVVQINFTTLVTHHSSACSRTKCTCDYVHVLDGPCPFYNSGTRWCGAWTSRNKYIYPSFTTTGRHMVLFFRSDDALNDIGFAANYRRALNCSGENPISCIKNSQASCCTREARACTGQTSVRSHCPRDGDPASHSICCTVNSTATCCYNPLSPVCARNATILTTRSGNFTSLNYPNQYPNNAMKIWKIVAPADYVIDFYFDSFDLEHNNDCALDFVQIRNTCDGKVPVARYCGQVAKSFRSSGNVLWIEFRSDSSIRKRGFSAFFVSVPKSRKQVSCPRPSDNQANIDYCFNGKDIECCNKDSPICSFDKLLTTNGTFTSPNYPNGYPQNTRFTWRITAPEGFLVQLNFTKFEIHHDSFRCSKCSCDYVSVRDGPCTNSAGTKWCGSYGAPPSYISTGRHLLVNFKSDSFYNRDGFKAHYRRALKCTGETPYSCVKEGIPSCCKTPEDKRSTASKTAIEMWFIVITITSSLSRTLA